MTRTFPVHVSHMEPRKLSEHLDPPPKWRVYIYRTMGSTDGKLIKIGEVARLTGFPVKTLRYYEERGLVESAERSEAGYRFYGEEEVARLKFIKKAKLFGLTLGEIAELVELAASGGRGKVIPHLEQVLESHLEETERKMASWMLSGRASSTTGSGFSR